MLLGFYCCRMKFNGKAIAKTKHGFGQGLIT